LDRIAYLFSSVIGNYLSKVVSKVLDCTCDFSGKLSMPSALNPTRKKHRF
jgi:hypothetical protein